MINNLYCDTRFFLSSVNAFLLKKLLKINLKINIKNDILREKRD